MTDDVPWTTALVVDQDVERRESLAGEIRRRDWDVITAGIADAELVAHSSAATAIVLCGDATVIAGLAVRLRQQARSQKPFIIGLVPDETAPEPAAAIDARAKRPDQVLAFLQLRRDLT
jgi:hypothetical protein